MRVAQIVGPEGRFPYLDATFDAAPDERADPRKRNSHHLWIGVSRDLLVTS